MLLKLGNPTLSNVFVSLIEFKRLQN